MNCQKNERTASIVRSIATVWLVFSCENSNGWAIYRVHTLRNSVSWIQPRFVSWREKKHSQTKTLLDNKRELNFWVRLSMRKEKLLRSLPLREFGKNTISCDYFMSFCAFFVQVAKWMIHCGLLVAVRTVAQ